MKQERESAGKTSSWLFAGFAFVVAAVVISFWIALLSSGPDDLWLAQPQRDQSAATADRPADDRRDAGAPAQEGADESDDARVIEIRVRDALSGKPIEQAIATATMALIESGVERTVRVVSSPRRELASGEKIEDVRTVRVRAWGYRDALLSGAFLEAAQDVWLQPVRSEADASIEVRLFDREGKPWAGATVTCTSPIDRFELDTSQKGLGRFEGLTAGTYTLETEAVEDAPESFISRARAKVAEGRMRIAYLGGAPRARVSVEVSDDRARLLGDVQVVLVSGRSWEGRTRIEDGTTGFGLLSPGFYELVLPGTTEWRFTDDVFVEPAILEEAQVVIGSQTLRGKVSRGRAFRVASCFVSSEAHRGRTAVDESGRFEFDRVPRGMQRLELELRDLPHRLWRPVEILVSGMEEVVELDDQLDDLGLVEIILAHSDGEPLGEVEVTCSSDDPANEGTLRPLGSGKRDETYGALVPAGRWRIRARAGTRVLWEDAVEVTSGERASREANVQ